MDPLSVANFALDALKTGSAMVQGFGAEQRARDRTAYEMSLNEKYNIAAEQRANEEWWKRQRHMEEYNDPSAQAARIRAAGGNPLALFGNQGFVSNSPNPAAPSMASPQSAKVDPMFDLQLAKLSAETNLLNAQARNLESDTDTNKQGIKESDSRIALNNSTIDLNKAYEDLVNQQAKTEEQRTAIERVNAYVAEATKQTTIDRAAAELRNALQTYDNLVKQGQLTDAETDYYKQLRHQSFVATLAEYFDLNYLKPAQLANTNASTALFNAQAENERANARRLDALTAKDAHDMYLSYNKFIKDYGKLYGMPPLTESVFDDIVKNLSDKNFDKEGVSSFTDGILGENVENEQRRIFASVYSAIYGTPVTAPLAVASDIGQFIRTWATTGLAYGMNTKDILNEIWYH